MWEATQGYLWLPLRWAPRGDLAARREMDLLDIGLLNTWKYLWWLSASLGT